MNPLTNKNLLIFLGGVAVGVFGAKLVKSERFRQLCLLGTAKGIQLKDELGTLFAEAQERAADFLAEAGTLAGKTESAAEAETPTAAVPAEPAPTARRRRGPRSRATAATAAAPAVRKPRKPRAKKNEE